MELNFTVENLNITFEPPAEPTVNDSINYITAHFTFTGSPWDKATVKTAVFHQLNKAYSVLLNNDSCFVPFEVLKNGGFAVGVATAFEEDGVTKTVYTKMCIVNTSPSCYSECFTNPEVTPSQYEQIMAFLKFGGGVIEVVKVNGETLVITDKSVDIPVPVKTSDLVNDNNFVSLTMLNEAQSYKVDKIEGKGLSSNDYTDEDKEKINSKEDISNKVTSISSTSTDTEYPSAKCVYDLIGDLETLLGGI